MVQITVDKSIFGTPLKAPIEIDRYLYTNLEELHKWIKNDWDNIGLNVGMEGAGKTETSFLIALALFGKLSLDQVFFNAEQFFEWADNAPKGSIGIWDEGDQLGGHWANEVLKSIKTRMKRMRDRNLTVLINTPTVEDLGKYFVIHRTRFLVYTFARAADNRGWYHLYSYQQKHQLFLNIKKYGELKNTFDSCQKAVTNGYIKGISNQDCVKAAGGDWNVLLDFSKEEYKDKKAAATREVDTQAEKAQYRYNKRVATAIVNLSRLEKVKLTQDEICNILGYKSNRQFKSYYDFAIKEGIFNGTV